MPVDTSRAALAVAGVLCFLLLLMFYTDRDHTTDKSQDMQPVPAPVQAINMILDQPPAPRTNFQPDCSISRFKAELRLDAEPPVIPVQLLARCQVVIYNRVPKCGSRTMDAVLKTVARQNHFQHIRKIHTTFEVDPNFWDSVIPDLVEQNQTFVLTSHHYFTSFHKWYNDSAIYINIIRDPVSWFCSSFFWNKYLPRSKFFMPREYQKKSIEECVANRSCFEWLPDNWGPVRYLCGHGPSCVEYKMAVGQALTNLQDQYLVVGLLEQLESFTEVLEFLLPHLFRNMTNIFRAQESASRSRFKSPKKPEVSSSSLQAIRRQMGVNLLFYDHVTQEFQRLLEAIRKVKASVGDLNTGTQKTTAKATPHITD